MTATHPTDRELEHFLLGKLADSDYSQVESHLADCRECADRALAAPPDDTLTELLAAARTRADAHLSVAPTPTLDGSATPPAFAPTLAWSGPVGSANDTAPYALATHPKYRVIRRLGTGGMGTVWLAEHQVMNRPVAVKVIRPDLLARPGATRRFLREVRAAAKLHHPNIVTAFDAEPVGDSCLLVMEYVPGQTLGERLDAGPLPVTEACRAVRDAARGLAHAHAAGLVHRDVKPHNLIRAADGTTKVLDFGLAGVAAGETVASSGDGLSGAGMVVGTPDYIAPEQIADPHAADARADIYGLGCTLYHLLAGRPPLPNGSISQKLAAQAIHEPDPIPGLAADVAAVLAKMLAKRADDRYQTADEVVDALDKIIDGVRPTPSRKWACTAKPWSAVTTLIFVAIVIAAGVVFKIERDNQIVQVEVDDPDIEVVMKRKGEIVLIRDSKSGHTWEYDTIKHEIGLVDQPDGLKLGVPEKEPFVLRRKGERAFTVTRLATWSTLDPSREVKMEAATRAAEAWLKLIDSGEHTRAWDEAGANFRRVLTKEDAIRAFQITTQKTGKLQARTVVNRRYTPTLNRMPDGHYVAIDYGMNTESGTSLTELVIMTFDPDGRWRVASYSVQSRGGPFGDPRAKLPAPGKDPVRGTGNIGFDPSVAAPQLLRSIDDRRSPHAIAYTPDGRALLAAGHASFAMYDPATGKELLSDDLGFAMQNAPLAVSADGKTAVVATGDLFVYDLAARKRAAKIERDRGKNFVPITAVTLTPDGQKVAYVAGREVVYHDRVTGQVERTRPDDDTVNLIALRYSPDGRFLAVASQVEPDLKTRISLLDAKTRELVWKLTSLTAVTTHFSADNQRLFIASTGDSQRTFFVLGLTGGKEIEREADLPTGPGTLVPSPDGRLLALVATDGNVQVWDRGKKQVVFAWAPHPNARSAFYSQGPKRPPLRTSVAFAPNGRTLATARGDQIRLWDLTVGAPAAGTGKSEKTDPPTPRKK